MAGILPFGAVFIELFFILTVSFLMVNNLPRDLANYIHATIGCGFEAILRIVRMVWYIGDTIWSIKATVGISHN